MAAGGDFVAEDLAPGAEGLVAGDDQAGAFVAAARRDGEYEVGGVRVNGMRGMKNAPSESCRSGRASL